jgi:negative regulator of flagellin synthesis FlgM
MKITDDQTVANIKTLTAKPVEKPHPPAISSKNRRDRVTLSPRARELRDAQQALASIPDVREDRVEEIKIRIEDGSYRIDSKAIATKMIRETLSEDE